MKNQLTKIFIIESTGLGGIAHYTYHLANSLANLNNSVTVYTSKSELSHFKRNFELNFHMDSSFLKKYLKKMLPLAFLSSKKSSTKNKTNFQGKKNLEIENMISNNYYSKARGIIIWIELIISFLVKRPHIIHIQWLPNPATDWFFLIILRILGFKIVYTAHNVLPHDEDDTKNRRAFGRIYRIVNKIIVHSRSNEKELSTIFRLSQKKISVIPHGTYDLFQKNVDSMWDAKNKLGIKSTRKVILFFGLIKRYKGLQYLLEAFLMVKSQIKDAFLVVAGRIGGKDEANHILNYRKKYEKLGIIEDTLFENRYIPFEDVSIYFAASDVVVLPYVKVYQSGVLMLAYNFSKPVVVTDTGGLSEVVEDQKNGYIVPIRNPSKLSESISKILQNEKLSERMGKYSKHLSLTKYSWATIAKQTIAVYTSLTS